MRISWVVPWLAGAACLSVVAIVVGELLGKSLFGTRAGGELPDTRNALVVALVGWLIAPFVLGALARFIGLSLPAQVAVGSALHVMVALAVLRPAMSGARRSTSAPGVKARRGVLAGLATFGVVFVLSLGVVAFYGALGVPPEDIPKQTSVALLQSTSRWGRVLIVFAACVMAPWAEEIVFRGILFPALARWMSERLALVVQALLFGFIHFPGDPASWPLVVPLAAVGWCAGWTYSRTGSLRTAIVLHMTFNAIQVGLLFATSGA